jgi:hypothetical protein
VASRTIGGDAMAIPRCCRMRASEGFRRCGDPVSPRGNAGGLNLEGCCGDYSRHTSLEQNEQCHASAARRLQHQRHPGEAWAGAACSRAVAGGGRTEPRCHDPRGTEGPAFGLAYQLPAVPMAVEQSFLMLRHTTTDERALRQGHATGVTVPTPIQRKCPRAPSRDCPCCCLVGPGRGTGSLQRM